VRTKNLIALYGATNMSFIHSFSLGTQEQLATNYSNQLTSVPLKRLPGQLLQPVLCCLIELLPTDSQPPDKAAAAQRPIQRGDWANRKSADVQSVLHRTMILCIVVLG